MKTRPTVHYLPIEPLEERYTAQMLRWVTDDLRASGLPYTLLLPELPSYKTVNHGQWLDTYNATRWRNLQMNKVVTLFEDGLVKDGDIFLIGDVWYPGIEAIRLMADLLHIKVKVAGWHYAGTFDPADLLHRELGPWGSEWERWLITEYLDAICVGSAFHADLLIAGQKVIGRTHILSYGLAWHPDEVIKYAVPTHEKIVVFPHRLAPEKNPDAFYRLARLFRSKGSDWRFVVSTNNPAVAARVPDDIETVCHADKDAYYRFLASCSIYYSNGTQETFGYALHEAIVLGLGVVAPDRCSYSEGLSYDGRFLYDVQRDPEGEALLTAHIEHIERTNAPLSVPLDYSYGYKGSTEKFLDYLENML